MGGFTSTLVMPLAWVALEYGCSVFSPYGSWGALAYTQAGNLPLLQVLSLTGIYGVSFLMVWLASTVNWAWERAFHWEQVRSGFLLYGGGLSLVLVAGGARLALFPPEAPTVAVASIAVEWGESDGIWRTLSRQPDAAALDSVREKTRQLHDKLFELSEQQSRSGARIVVWAELNGLVLEEDEPALLERARRLARERDVYLFLALGTFTPGQPIMENLHTQMAGMRAIENGVSLVRATYAGLTAAFDHQGRTLGAMDYFTTQPRVLVSHVPTRGVRTVYGRIGDAFAWLGLAALLTLAGLALARHGRD